MAQHQLRLMPERKAGISGLNSGFRPLQKTDRQFAFQPTDLLAQRGRHHVQLQRSTAHAAAFDNTDEIAKLPKFQEMPL
ncbi:hypothetical protein WS52_17670 [Burkholderia territorii]|nr:hypothetical protein WS52_17670 [Burkholderia territorii]KUZ59666.1 hypothetical protein WS53_07170 [Burkholderia territorii]